jgi:hypothetical protein
MTCSDGLVWAGLGEESVVLFEEYPIVLLVIIIVVIEAWIRVREPLFQLIAKALGKNTPS